MVKNPAMQRTGRRCSFDPWVRKILWSKKWQPTSSFLPRKSNGQKSLIAIVHGVEKNWTRLRDSTTNKKLCFYVTLGVGESKHGFNLHSLISHSYFFFFSFVFVHPPPPTSTPAPFLMLTQFSNQFPSGFSLVCHGHPSCFRVRKGGISHSDQLQRPPCFSAFLKG